ncbi:MAG: prepilin-type N-terminal cleavage/methylation domain-containing protein [Pyrinomonadaceae bacterium]
MRNRLHRLGRSDHGFSVTELLVVLGVIGVMSVISLPYLVNFKSAYRSEDQALKVIDLMREAGQMAMNRRRTIRFEIDYTDNVALIIDENGTAADAKIKKIPLEATKDVRMDIIPSTISKPNPPNYNDLATTTDALGHLDGATTINGHTVWAARFRSDGSVVTAANVPINANIYVWPPITPGSTTPKNKYEVRAITIFGGSGAIRYWKHNGTTFVANQ